MRLALILICLAALAATGWGATRGVDAPFLRGAQRIEARALHQVRTALGEAAGGIEASVSGRDVVLTGAADSEEARSRALATAAGQPLVRAVVDRVELLPVAAPFRLVMTRSADGLALAGHVPGRAAGEAFAADARALLALPVEAALEPARGAPGDWAVIARSALRALAPLSEGRVEIEDDAVRLTGIAADQAVRALALGAAADAPGR